MMWQNIIAGIVILVAAFVSIRFIYRNLRGYSNDCGGGCKPSSRCEGCKGCALRDAAKLQEKKRNCQ